MQNAATSKGNFLRRASICTKRLKDPISQHLNECVVPYHYSQLLLPRAYKMGSHFG